MSKIEEYLEQKIFFDSIKKIAFQKMLYKIFCLNV